jgi:hypothetical protein
MGLGSLFRKPPMRKALVLLAVLCLIVGSFFLANQPFSLSSGARTKNVIAFSLYGGANPRYTDGALANAKLYKTTYPGWSMRVFHDSSVPITVLAQLDAEGVELVDMTTKAAAIGLTNEMSWKFTVASDPTVDRFCSRDIDSRLSDREGAAVFQWVESGLHFHVLRDHPQHSRYPISGGMFCMTKDAVPNMVDLLVKKKPSTRYVADMDFLGSVVWPLAHASLLQHDAFSCEKFGGGLPFPTPRIGGEHVGAVYLDGKMRERDVQLLQEATQPDACQPGGPGGFAHKTPPEALAPFLPKKPK